MSRKHSFIALAALVLLSPGRLMAGGPPLLCLPIDGVTSDNVDECAALLTAKLESKLWPRGEHYGGIRIQQHPTQSYVTFYMREDVGLSDLDAALKGSDFAIPRDRLRFFGNVILQIDTGATAPQQLLADLEALDYVSVAESQNEKDRLVVTLEMPFPGDVRANRDAIDWDTFEWREYEANHATASKTPATRQTLPSYDAFHKALAKHDAGLQDIQWSTTHGCRALGAVAAPDEQISPNKTAQSLRAR